MALVKYVNPDFLNVSDSEVSDKLFIGENGIVIPYINIGLMPGNPITRKQALLEYSYYIFLKVGSILFNAQEMKLMLSFDSMNQAGLITDYIGFGGYKSSKGAELKIEFAESLLYVPENSQISQYPQLFTPVDTPHFKRNMDKDVVAAFFSVDNLPIEIIEILGGKVWELSLW